MPPVLLLVFILVLQNSVQIIVPGEHDNQKPLTNSPGIKTTILQVHHNYSKVSHQGSYQIHNAHTYGARPQVFVVNKSVVAENKDPDKPILIQKKRRQTSKIEVYHKCPTGATGQFVYDLSCNQFLNCWKGRGFVQNCAPGTLFNPKTLECDFAQKVECITGPRHNSLERSQKIVEQVGCPKDFSGIIPDYFDCSKFINCANGVENNMDCPPGTLFDVTKNICDFAHKASCFNGQNEKLVAAGGSESVGVNSKLDFYGSGCKFGQSGQCGAGGGSGSGTGNTYGQESTSYEQTQGHFDSGSYSSVTPCKNCQQSNRNSYGQGSVSYGGSQDQHSSNGNYNGGNRDFRTPCQNCRTSESSGNGPYGQPTTYAGSQDQHSYSSGSNLGSNYDYSQSHKGSAIPCQNCQHAHGGTNVAQTAYDQQSHNFGQSSGQAFGHQHQGQSQIENSGTNFGQSSNRGGYYQTHYGHATTNDREETFGQSQIDNSGTDFRQTLNHGQGGNYPSQYGHSSTSSSGHQYQKQGADFEQNSNHRSQFGQASSQQSAGHFSHQKVECPQGVAGIHRHPTDCSKFLNCANGQTFIQDCAPGTLFNPDNSVCDFPYKVKCEIGGSTSSQHSEGYDRNENRNYGNSDYSGRDQDNQENYEGSTAQQSNCNKKNNFCRTENTASASNIQENVVIEQTTIPNYQQVININQHVSATPKTPLRKPYEPFFGTTGRPRFNQQLDYEDVYNSAQSSKYTATTPRIEAKSWPPPFPSTDVKADYVFEYVDGDEITLEAENNLGNSKTTKKCQKGDFRCSPETCIPKTLVCNSRKDCPNGVDEVGCEDYVQQFSVEKNHKLAILEKQRWDNVSVRTCALLCLENQKFRCKSFNYRKIDKTCFLTNTNIAHTGALISYYPCDYYERISERIDCSSKFLCPNSKCIEKHQLCDGHDDCGDRTDEKNCNSENFGYGVKLTGTPNSHEGQIEVTAFGKTGFICDDKFGLRDADVVCRELGFSLGAVEVKTNSFYSRNGNINNTFYMMDDVTCVGNETKLMDCDFNGWGIHNCLSQEIVGVVCKTPQEKCSRDYWQCDTGQECLPVAFVCDGLLDCTDNSDEEKHHCDAPTEVKLVNGTNPRQGRIEIKHNGIWGSICDDDFNEDAGKVVCKQLGFKGSSVVKKDGYFGAGGGPIWLDQVSCTGNETAIEECTHWNWGEHNCEHSEDVGVICSHIETHERHSTHVEPERNRLEFHPQKCGLRNDNIFGINDEVHFRVVRGSFAPKGEYPWQAALRVKGRTKPTHWCGAVVISEKFVLTAAHCLMGYSKGAYVVVAGDYNVDEDEGTEQTAFIDDYFIHEDFRKDHKMNNDIALIRLKGHGFTLSGEVQALCLPDEEINYEKDLNCTISGFGSIESGKSGFSHNLRAGWIPLQKRNICSMPHVYGDALTEGMICAGSLDEGVDSCDGDSGGPLACLNNGLFTLYGITSWGQHCGYANKPGVYVKVAHYRKWIDDTMQKHWVAEN